MRNEIIVQDYNVDDVYRDLHSLIKKAELGNSIHENLLSCDFQEGFNVPLFLYFKPFQLFFQLRFCKL